MKTILNYIQEHLLTGHTTNQNYIYSIPTKNFSITDNINDLLNEFSGQWFEINKGELESFTEDYFVYCIKHNVNLPIDVFVEDYIGYLEQMMDIDSKASKEIEKVFSKFIKDNFIKK